MKKKLIWLAPLAILALAGFIVLGGYIVQQLWNWLLPSLFGVRQVTLWEGLGILVLCRILFGGFGMHGSDSSRRRKRDRHAAMTPEEKERFRQAGGFGAAPSESPGQ